MDSKTVNLNCLTLGELENKPIFKNSGVFLELFCFQCSSVQELFCFLTYPKICLLCPLVYKKGSICINYLKPSNAVTFLIHLHKSKM